MSRTEPSSSTGQTTPRSAASGVTSEKSWNVYSSRTKWPATVYDVRVVATRLLQREMPGGTRIAHGLVTLAAEPVAEAAVGSVRGVSVWRATWARKRRGVDWTTERGYIAVTGDEIGHGQTIASAVRSAQRREFAQTPGGRAAALRGAATRQRTLETLCEILEGDNAEYEHVRVSLRDARSAGLCRSGILAFCSRHFPLLDPDVDTVTVADLLATGSERNLVVTACAVAIRRAQRALCRADAS